MAINIPGTDVLLGGGGPVGPTTPMSFVNLAVRLFGRESSFPTKFARSITRESRSIFGKQLGILEKAGGTGSDIYKRLKAGQAQLNSIAGTGSPQKIAGMRQGLLDLFGAAQDVISPIPEGFKFSAKEHDPRRAGSSRLGKGATPFRTTEQFFRINQFLDKLQGKGQVLTRTTGRTKGRRGKPIIETLGQGFFVDAPIPEVKGGGRARQGRIRALARQQPTFVQIKPFDIDAIRGRLGVTIQDVAGLGKPQPPSQKKGIDKKQVGRVAMKAARQFLRFPTREPREFRRSGFISKGRAMGDISELEQGVDRIIPSGFTSKQPTTQSRALALSSLR